MYKEISSYIKNIDTNINLSFNLIFDNSKSVICRSENERSLLSEDR